MDTAKNDIHEKMYMRFCMWVEYNGDGMRAMRNKGRDMVRRHKHPSARYLLEWLRYDSDTKIVDIGDEFKINNSWAPIIARIIKRDIPDLAPHIELRTSIYDKFELPTIDW